MLDLPEGYIEKERLELVNDGVLMRKLVIISLAVFIGTVVSGLIIAPFRVEITSHIPMPGTILIFLLVYMVFVLIHELIHGIFMKLFTGAKVKYGFNLTYAYAGSDAYFTKYQHIIVGLAPVVIIGVFLLLLSIFMPKEWFWDIHILQIVNLFSAGGDFFMANHIRKQPADVLVKDDGPSMSIYVKEEYGAKN